MEAEKQLMELQSRCRNNREIANQVQTVNQTCLKTAEQVQAQIVPLQSKVMRLKSAIYGMHIKMGCTADQANYYMLTEANEWENMAESVTNIIRQGNAGKLSAEDDSKVTRK